MANEKSDNLPDLNNLTEDQHALVASIRDKWIQVEKDTRPANRPEAEAGLRQAYKDCGLNPPLHIFWVDSPYAAAVALGILPDAIDAAYTLVESAVNDIVKVPTDQIARKQYVVPPIPIDVAAVEDWWRSSTYGQHSSGYFAYLQALRELGYPDLAIDGCIQVAENAGWWWPAEQFAIVTERPTFISRDQNNLLHCEDGPAIVYPDGWGLWVWHGTQVPKELIRGEWDTARILKEENTEVRRCAIEHRGWERFVYDAKFEQVGKDEEDPGNPGHFLQLFDLPEKIFNEPVRVLLCDNATTERDGTRRRFGLTVPGNAANPIAAAAWTFNLTEREYRQLQRAT